MPFERFSGLTLDEEARSTLEAIQLPKGLEKRKQKYLDAFDFIFSREEGEWKEKPPGSLLDLNPEEFRHICYLVEAGMQLPEITLYGTNNFSEKEALCLCIIVGNYLAADNRISQEKLSVLRANIREALRFKISDDLPLVLKCGLDAPEEMVPQSSMVFFGVCRAGPEKWSNPESLNTRLIATRHKSIEMLESGDPELERLAAHFLDGRDRAYTTPLQRVSAPARYLLKKMKPRELLSALYEREFETLVGIIGENAIHAMCMRSNGTPTEEDAQELLVTLGIVGFTKNFIQALEDKQGIADFRKNPEKLKGYMDKRVEEEMERVAKAIAKMFPRLQETMETVIEKGSLNRRREFSSAFTHTPAILAEAKLLTDISGPLKDFSPDPNVSGKSFSNLAKFWPHRQFIPLLRQVMFSLVAEPSLKENSMDAPVVKLTEELIEAADNAPELALYLLRNSKLATPANLTRIHHTLRRKVLAKPELLRGLVKILIVTKSTTEEEPEISETDGFTSFYFWKILLDPSASEFPALTNIFFDCFRKPDFQTLEHACIVTALHIDEYGIQSPFVNQFLRAVAPNLNDYHEPRVSHIIGNVRAYLDEKDSTAFVEKVDEYYQRLLRQSQAAEKRQQEKLDTTMRAAAPGALLVRLSSEAYPLRQNAGIIEEIRDHRSIHISVDGHEVSLHAIDSPLTETFSRCRVKRNKETGNPSEGLACNINFISKDGVTVYAKLTAEGELVIRFLDEKNQDKKTVGRTGSATHGISQELFDELHYCALEILKIIYVRKSETAQDRAEPEEPAAAPEPPVTPETPMEPATEPDKKPPAPEIPPEAPLPPPLPIFAPGMPEASEREEGAMAIDLTDSEKVRNRKREKAERILIETNRAKAIRVFGQLTNSMPLPESAPAETAELLLHRRVRIAGSDCFEPFTDSQKVYQDIRDGTLSPSEVFVRKSRAFAVSLPYVMMSRHVGNDPTNTRYHVVRQKQQREVAALKADVFRGSEHGEAFDLSSRERVLFFDVEDDNGLNHQIFERVQSGSDIPGMIDALAKEIGEQLEETINEIMKNESDPVVLEKKVLEVYEKAGSDFVEQTTALSELASKTTSVQEWVVDPNSPQGVRLRARLRLPQAGFIFAQTFNQGKFESMEGLLRIPKTAEQQPEAA